MTEEFKFKKRENLETMVDCIRWSLAKKHLGLLIDHLKIGEEPVPKCFIDAYRYMVEITEL